MSAFEQPLGDLHGVECGSLEELVAAHEQRKRASRRVAEVRADAAHQDVVGAGGFRGHREVVGGAIVHHVQAGCGRQDLAGAGRRHRLIEGDGDGHGVRSQHRHADAGDADRQVGDIEDTPGLCDHLQLFAIVADVGIHLGIVAEQVEGVGMRQHLGRERVAAQIGGGGLAQLFHGGGAGARSRLIG